MSEVNISTPYSSKVSVISTDMTSGLTAFPCFILFIACPTSSFRIVRSFKVVLQFKVSTGRQ